MDERGCMRDSGKYLKSGSFQPEWWQLWPGIGGNFKTEWVAVLLRIMHYDGGQFITVYWCKI